jgi:hypothetical protein
MVLAADMRVRRPEFGIAKRTNESNKAAEQPQTKESGVARNVRRNHLRRLEYANADDDANEQRAKRPMSSCWGKDDSEQNLLSLALPTVSLCLANNMTQVVL